MSADNLIPAKDKWEFDDAVTKVFGDMLGASIPGLDDMRYWVDKITAWVVDRQLPPARTAGRHLRVLDLGASLGDAVARVVPEFPHVQFGLIETSEPMRTALREKFQGAGNVRVYDNDLRYDRGPVYAPTGFDNVVVLSVLTQMFIPVEHRQGLVSSVYDALAPGGVFVSVEKTLGDSTWGEDRLTEWYYDFKRDQGYNEEAIMRKRMSLEGVLVPLRSTWCEDVLRQAGFARIQKFWQSGPFVGWVAEK